MADNEIEHAIVNYRNKKAGLLIKKPHVYEFIYDQDYLTDPEAMPISLGLPLRQEKYESKELFPFFDGLLPEGWLLDLTCTAAKIDKRDKFHILLHTGQDPVGAISILPFEHE